MNPIDILGVDPSGAHKSPVDVRDYKYEEVAHASLPFDWSVGYDYEAELGTILKVPFKTPIKNQGASGSCGGQSEGYLGASISTIHDNTYEEKSAKFTYAPIAVRPGGGSSGRDLATRASTIGWGSEALTTSYQNGQPPSEEFMQQVQDITPAAIQHAHKDKALSYVLLPLDIDSVAQAIRDYKGVRIGVVGSNNGSWLTVTPVAPVYGQTLWYHWVTGLKAKMINGKKAIGFPNSWGTQAGDQGWQWLTEDYFKAMVTNSFGLVPIFEPRCYIWNTTPPPVGFTHNFTTDLQLSNTGPEVKALQTALQLDGDFPASIAPTEYYGSVTQQSVQKFQVKYNITNVNGPGYGRCGPVTRGKLNQLFNH